MRKALRKWTSALAALAVSFTIGLGAIPEAAARAAQACNDSCVTIDTTTIGALRFEDYRVTNPNVVFADVAARRAALAALGATKSQQWSAVSALSGTQGSLPTVSFGQAAVTIAESVFQSNGQTQVNEFVSIAFTNFASSEGFSSARFGLFFIRGYATTRLTLQFRPTIDANLAAVPGLTSDISITVDPVQQTVSIPSLAALETRLQRAIMAVAYRLPEILAANTGVSRGAPTGDRTLWAIADVGTAATLFRTTAFSTPQRTLAPVTTFTCDLRPVAYTSCAEQSEVTGFERFVSQYGADYLWSGSATTASVLLTNLRAWAQANALLTFPGYVAGNPEISDARLKYNLNFPALPLINTWVMLRTDASVTTADRALIDSWIGRLVAFTTEPYGGPANSIVPNNHGYLQFSVKMAWAIATGDHTAFAESIERFYVALTQMRTDGSFPLEVARGACALRYQNASISNLMAIAEMAYLQGYDLYRLSAGGKRIHDAIRFLLDASDNPALVAGYAAAAGVCDLAVGAPMETRSYREVDGAYVGASWVEPYIARFPSHPNSARASTLLASGLAAARPAYHPHQGGNATAFSAIAEMASGPIPIQPGWWWNPAEPGRGFSLETNGANMFFAGFLYAADGTPVWHTAAGSVATGGTFSAPLAAYSGGQVLGGPYRAPSSLPSPGNVSIAFSSPTTGSMTLAGATVPVERFDFVSGGVAAGVALDYPESGWWWNASEGGRGYFIEWQGSTVFLAMYMYDARGQATWYISQTAMTAPSAYQGVLQACSGGMALSGSFRTATCAADHGAVSIVFTGTRSGVLTFPNGVQVAIQRFAF